MRRGCERALLSGQLLGFAFSTGNSHRIHARAEEKPLGLNPDRKEGSVRPTRTGRTAGLAERERRGTPPFGGVFVARTEVMSADEMQRAMWRMAHEIVERNHGVNNLILVGLQTGGVPIAARLADALEKIEETRPFVGTLDVAFHRDDIGLRPVLPEAPTELPDDLTGRTVVLVDDVLYTGRTVRAALDALHDFGRPRAVQLAVIVDRGHRELPIRADYVGKNLPTRSDEAVNVTEHGVELGEVTK